MAGMGPMKVLGHISESMAGVSAQHVKIDASSARDGLKPSSSISFSIPQNALVDLDTLAIHGKVSVTGGLMPSATSLIERFEVSIGGQVISGGSSFYGITQAMLEANTGCGGPCYGARNCCGDSLPSRSHCYRHHRRSVHRHVVEL